ncbi:hypothetical protein [Fluviicola sp.]|uniref:hypothetical protein n=1 Tax=Fluviicola sp. TaxID=1917219 RepID=UPI0031D2C16A
MKHILFFSIVFFVSQTGCQENQSKKVPNLQQKALHFRNDFTAYNLNYFTDSLKNEFISFADFVTAKKIHFHTIDGKQKWSIDLKQLMDSEKEKFIYYHVVSPDSILLLSKYSNRIYLINQKAEVLKKLDYSRLLMEGIEFVPPIYVQGNTVFHAFNNYPVKQLTTQEEQLNWELESFGKNCIAQTSLKDESQTPEYIGQNLFNRFIKRNEILADGVHFYLNQSKIYYHSAYSDTIYSITKDQIRPLFKVQSEIGKIFLKPSTRSEYVKNTNCINEAYLKQAFITSLLFDNRRNLIYVLVRKPQVGEHFPFNVLVYDQAFKKRDEFQFDGTQHHPNGFIGKKGLYLLRNYDKTPNQKSFDLLTYEN